MGQPGLFLFIFVFSNTNFTEKTVGISRIQTRIVRVEGEHANHLTTTTALAKYDLVNQILCKVWPENTCTKGKDHSTAGLQFNKIGFDQRRKCVGT